jgi:hypothetical protein
MWWKFILGLLAGKFALDAALGVTSRAKASSLGIALQIATTPGSTDTQTVTGKDGKSYTAVYANGSLAMLAGPH